VLRAAAQDPDITIRDDGLRIMRMARFAAELRLRLRRS
jgi:tRNA nucleotidyltransferase/poly(A) polymerase